MTRQILAGLDAAAFLRLHWQKKPLLARQALPEFTSLLTRKTLFELAARDDVHSRLVTRYRGRWQVEHGPFAVRALARLPKRNWTLLVQGVNHLLPRAQELLLEFAFIPYARLDDIMVSYAPPGGGVGPHFDSYDVFLLQLAGTRRWRVSAQRDLSLVDGAPLKILRRFQPRHEWLLHPGDMLYLPPRYAHDGDAVDECLTCSIGFRAPGAQELGTSFLEFLQDRLALDGIYRDADLKLQEHPAQISTAMLQQMRRMLERIRWQDSDIVQFAGQFLTEPKPHIVFDPPHRLLSPAAFVSRVARQGVRLALKSQMLCRGRQVFINGERCVVHAAAALLLLRFADQRRLPPNTLIPEEAAHWLYQWYRAGYIELERSVSGKRKKPEPRPTAGFAPTAYCLLLTADRLRCPNMEPSGNLPNAEYRRFESMLEYEAVIDSLIPLTQTVIRVFDKTLSRAYNSPQRHAALSQFLLASRTNRLTIVLHETETLERNCPRLLLLLQQFSHSVCIRQTLRMASQVYDPFVIFDASHYVHRFHYDHMRAAQGTHDVLGAQQLLDRFEEILEASVPAVSANVSGL